MKKKVLWSLVAINALLLLALAARFSRDNQARAQVRRPAEYVMIPGEVNGASSAVIYMVDETNGLLGALTYDNNTRQLNMMPPIDLSRVFQTGPNVGARQPPGVAPGAGVNPRFQRRP